MLNKYYNVTVSKVGIENNRVDEATLFQVVKGVQADDIFKKTLEYGIGNWELVNIVCHAIFQVLNICLPCSNLTFLICIVNQFFQFLNLFLRFLICITVTLTVIMDI